MLSISAGCNSGGIDTRLLGNWEGSIPFPAAGGSAPISYDFRADGVTIVIGLGDDQSVSEWTRWAVAGEVSDDLVVHLARNEERPCADSAATEPCYTERVFDTQVRFLDDDQIMLWDLGSTPDGAARVRRVATPSEGEAESSEGEE